MRRPRRYQGLKDNYRLDRLLPPSQKNGKRRGFETEHAALTEDSTRARSLVRSLGADTVAVTLGRELAGETMPETMASARWMRDERLEFGAAVIEGLEPWPAKKIAFFAGIPISGEVPADKLDTIDPKALKERLRQQINRLGLTFRSGFLVAIFEAEFEPVSKIYRFHFHGAATGSYVKALRLLQQLPAYKRRDHVHQPFQIKKLTSDADRPQAVSYLLKSHWKQRRIGPVGEDCVVKRDRKYRRLEEPHHAYALLWLDRHSVSDITLFMGCRMRNSKLELTDPRATDRT
ncbi:hypothetical protein GGQ87_001291 [Brevundimonas alba]|uniref:Uncharacterized protein n=1 Tax=Brevundimonas alba TaxID=74314 RepID=A0A7X6BMG3_9CAUL|nr:hypothetical protein [Brevundimonas alba]NJC41033.1 hypothetical protein [Brevundimonas alba]